MARVRPTVPWRAVCVALLAMLSWHRVAGAEPACRAGTWLDPATATTPAHPAVLAAAARRGVVLLGEQHDEAEHHRWQLSVIAGLLALRGELVLGFEAFPRRVQPVLDRWIAGELGVRDFLDQTEWREVWGLDPELYLPLFHLARLHRIPMVALNVERALVARVGREGWAAVPRPERQGVGDPAPPAEPYLDRLAGSFAQHQRARESGRSSGDRGGAAAGEATDRPAVRDRPEFARFVEAQLTWDRAMAEALAEARRRPGAPLVVGIVGAEHLRGRYGVPHQLAALGVADAAVLLPHDARNGCTGLAGIADAVFLVDSASSTGPPRPRLGVVLSAADGGVRVTDVAPGSIAQAAGIEAGDLVVQAAAVTLERGGDLAAIVQRQAPGTWLPLVLRRDGRTVETVAKFPPAEPGAR